MKLIKNIITIGVIAASIAISSTTFAANNSVNLGDKLISLSDYANIYNGEETIELNAVRAVYTGSQIKPSPVITYEGEVLEEGTDYDLTYGENINAGDGFIYVAYKGNYEGTKTITFTIYPRELSNDTVSFSSISNQTYIRSQIKPEPTITYKSKTLVKDQDYELSYNENINIGTATINVTFKNNYDGLASTTFNITAKSLNQSDVTFTNIDDLVYTGSELTPEPTVKFGDVTLINGTDYDFSYKNNTDVGTAIVTVTFKSNYTGEASTTFEIVQKSLSNADITISDIPNQTFTGREIKPEPEVKYGDKTLIKGTDYELNYNGNVNIGEGTVNIQFIGNYTGTGSKTFTINKWTLSDGDFTITNISDQVYTGRAIEPNLEIKVGATTLIKGTDYNVVFNNNTEKGTATASIEFIGNYDGDTSATFEIITLTLSQDNVTIADIPDYTYNRHECKPEPEVKLGNTVLVKDQDYELSYENNVNAGTATLKVTGIGNFNGNAQTTFRIKPRNGAEFTYYLIFFDDEDE